MSTLIGLFWTAVAVWAVVSITALLLGKHLRRTP